MNPAGNVPNRKPNMFKCVPLLLALVISSHAAATASVINVTPINNPVQFHAGTAIDRLTGKYYLKESYQDGTPLHAYDSAADLAALSASSTVTPATFGPYFAVHNNRILGRPSDSSTQVASYDMSGGMITSTSIPGTIGTNGSGTFDWGGFSGMNWFSDSTGLYNLGGTATNQWLLTKLDSDLNILEQQSVPHSGDGFAFMVDGKLFIGDDYNDPTVDYMFDTATATGATVSHSIAGLGGALPLYITNTTYDPFQDRLYVQSGGQMYLSESGLANALGIAAVPEPGSVGVLAILGVATIVRRRKRCERSGG